MSDEENRAKEREGELDLPGILRTASDRKRRLWLIRLCAKLGHEEAERWRRELDLHPMSEDVNEPWHALSRDRAHAWLLDELRRGVAAEEREGRVVRAEVAVATEATIRRLDGQGTREEQDKLLDGLWALMGRLDAEADAGSLLRTHEPTETPASFLRAYEPTQTPASVLLQSVATFVGLGLVNTEEDWSVKALCLLLRLQHRAALSAQVRGLSGDVNEALEVEEGWQLTRLRDAYLWPEVIRP